MKPAFICIGAQKAGTSWLYHQCMLHQEFSMLPIKEIHYFDRSPDYPSPNYLSRTKLVIRLKNRQWVKQSLCNVLNTLKERRFSEARWYWRWHFSNYTDEWYLSLFDYAQDKLTGDITPSYSILNEDDVRRLYLIAGNPKIIFLIRNPIDRAWSMWRFRHIRFGPNLYPFDIVSIKEKLDSLDQELRSDYKRTLDIYCRIFEPEQILVGFYDAIGQDPAGLMTAILHHIGAKNTIPNEKEIYKRIYVSKKMEMPVLIRDHLIDKYRDLIEYLSVRLGSYAIGWLYNIDRTNIARKYKGTHYIPAVHP